MGGRFEGRIQDLNKQCQLLGQRGEPQQNQLLATDTIRELRGELREQICNVESQQHRLLTFESKIPTLEAKAEAIEAFVKEQLQVHNTSMGLNEMVQLVTTSVAATSKRIETSTTQRCQAMEVRFAAEVGALGMSLETKFLTELEELRTTQKCFLQFMEEEKRIKDSCMRKEWKDQTSSKPSIDLNAVENRFRDFSTRIDQVEKSNEKMSEALKSDIADLDSQVATQMLHFADDVGFLKTQKHSLQVSIDKSQNSLQRVHSTIGGLQAGLMRQDTRVDDVQTSLEEILNSLRTLEERQVSFEEFEMSRTAC